MKKNLLLPISLVANAVLAALFIRSRSDHALQELTRAANGRVEATTEVSRIVHTAETRHETNVHTIEHTNTAALPNIWKQVAAADYQQFADNLRTIGVPEETVRDIVMLDLMKTLGEDITALARGTQAPFWNQHVYSKKGGTVSNQVAAIVTQAMQLTQNTLGIDPAEWFADRWGWTEIVSGQDSDLEYEPLMEMLTGMMFPDYDWLPTERARALHRLVKANERQQSELEARIAAIKDKHSPEFEALQLELSKVIQAGEKIEDNFLTPEEKRERDLRDDSGLQQQLAGVDVSRAEYEKLHDLAKSIGATEPPYFKPNTPEAAQALGILGQERFVEFLRGSDSRYGQILQTCSDFEIPRQTVQKIYEVGLTFDQRIGAGGADADALVAQAKKELQDLIPDAEKREAIASAINAYFSRR